MSALSPAIPPSPGRRCSLPSRPDAHASRPHRAAKRGKATGMPGSGSDARPGPRSRCRPRAPGRSPPLARAARLGRRPARRTRSPLRAWFECPRVRARADATGICSAEGGAARRGGSARRYRARPRPRARPGGQAGTPAPSRGPGRLSPHWPPRPAGGDGRRPGRGACFVSAGAAGDSPPAPRPCPRGPPGAGDGGRHVRGAAGTGWGGAGQQWRTGSGGGGRARLSYLQYSTSADRLYRPRTMASSGSRYPHYWGRSTVSPHGFGNRRISVPTVLAPGAFTHGQVASRTGVSPYLQILAPGAFTHGQVAPRTGRGAGPVDRPGPPLCGVAGPRIDVDRRGSMHRAAPRPGARQRRPRYGAFAHGIEGSDWAGRGLSGDKV